MKCKYCSEEIKRDADGDWIDRETFSFCEGTKRKHAPVVPKELDAIVDAVLAYKPKPKTKAAKRRIRRKKKAAKNQRVESSI